MMWDSSTHVKLVLLIKDLNLWWVEVWFLNTIYIVDRNPFLSSWAHLSLGGLSYSND